MAKSFFFQKFHPADPNSEYFIKDLERLVAAPEQAWMKLLERAGDYVRASTTPAKRTVVEDLARATGQPAVDVAFHMRCLDTLLAVFSENEEETPEHLASDFVAIGGIDAQLESVLVERLRAVRKRFSEDVALIDEEDARIGVLPVIDLVRTTTEMRGVFHRTMAGDERLETIVGIISVNLSLDAAQDALFQVDRAGAEYLIAELQAALRRLTLLEEQVGLNTGTAASPPSTDTVTSPASRTA